MFGQTFYHKTLRKYVILFGTLFNDIYINRVDSSNNNVQTLKVPITYGPKQKTVLRTDGDPQLNRPFSLRTPVMAFEMTGMRYASDRKLTTTKKHSLKVNTLNSEQNKYVYNPVPYDIDFTLYINVKNAEDGTRILEQILPYFTPEWTTTVNIIPEVDAILDIPVVIGSVQSDDTYEGPVDQGRDTIWTLTFTMKGYLFGPVRKGEVIKLANTNFFPSMSNTATYDRTLVYPGLTANGTPTTNPAETVDRVAIVETDDWAYITVKEIVEDE